MNWFSKEKIKWILKRHPLLYYSRYVLLSDNYKGENPEEAGCYNEWNKSDDLPEIYREVSRKIHIPEQADDLEKAIAIASYLRINCKGGRGLSRSSKKTLQYMLDGTGGICNDFSQVFNNFCLLHGIRVKEWNCVDRFYKTNYGHTFNEVYSPALGKWVLIDVHQAFYFTDENQQKLSTIETFTRLREGNTNTFVSFVPAYWHQSMERLNHIYSKYTIPFLTVKYDNKAIDRYLDRWAGKLPLFLITSMMIACRDNFRFLFVMDDYWQKLKFSSGKEIGVN